MRPRLVVAFLLGLLVPALARADYDEAFVRARAQAGAGAWAQAAAILDEEAHSWPEDFAIQLERAYYHLRAGELPAAEAGYRAALLISPSSIEARLGLADALAGARRFEEAKPVTAALAAARPADATILVRHAFVLFSLGDYDAAERGYAAALETDPESLDAVLGLGWVAQRRGQTDRARERFDSVIARAPGNASALEGLALLDAAVPVAVAEEAGAQVSVSLFGYGQAYVDHPGLEAQYGLVAGLDATFARRWYVGARYRGLQTTAANPNAGAGQHEGYLSLGLVEPRWGLMLHGAVLGSSTLTLQSSVGTNPPPRPPGPGPGGGGPHGLLGVQSQGLQASPAATTMVGLSGRVRWGADFTASAVYTFYEDDDVAQLELGAAIPIVRWLRVEAGGRMQRAAGAGYLSGSLELVLHGGGWLLGAGGTLGEQLRPVELGAWSVYNVPDAMLGALRLRATMPVSAALSLSASYELERYRSDLITSSVESDAHRGAFGIQLTF